MNTNSALRKLDLEPGATFQEVQSAYHERLKLWHPEHFNGEPGEGFQRMAELNAAYEFLQSISTSPDYEFEGSADSEVDEWEATNRATKEVSENPTPPSESSASVRLTLGDDGEVPDEQEPFVVPESKDDPRAAARIRRAVAFLAAGVILGCISFTSGSPDPLVLVASILALLTFSYGTLLALSI